MSFNRTEEGKPRGYLTSRGSRAELSPFSISKDSRSNGESCSLNGTRYTLICGGTMSCGGLARGRVVGSLYSELLLPNALRLSSFAYSLRISLSCLYFSLYSLKLLEGTAIASCGEFEDSVLLTSLCSFCKWTSLPTGAILTVGGTTLGSPSELELLSLCFLISRTASILRALRYARYAARYRLKLPSGGAPEESSKKLKPEFYCICRIRPSSDINL